MDRIARASKKINQADVVDFVSWFQREYLKRRQKNPSYSIRSFANFLGISPATISHLLAGKRRPSANYASRLFARLDVTPEERDVVLSSLSDEILNVESTTRNDFETITLDSFKILSDWYHYAILELISIKDFRYDFQWIAMQLEISVTEARQAVERLLRLDLVEEKSGTLIKTKSLVTNGDDFLTSSAHKQLQRHILQRALDAIDTVPIEEKDISSMTMAIDIKKIPQAKKLITKFRRDLCKYLENGHQTRVYQLGIQLYPASKKNRGEI